MENDMQKIVENIRRANPDFTADILDLLYEYVLARYREDCSTEKITKRLEENEAFKKVLASVSYDSFRKSE